MDIVCCKCNKKFTVVAQRQIPGFREMEECYCPHCNEVAYQSMEYENFQLAGE